MKTEEGWEKKKILECGRQVNGNSQDISDQRSENTRFAADLFCTPSFYNVSLQGITVVRVIDSRIQFLFLTMRLIFPITQWCAIEVFFF